MRQLKHIAILFVLATLLAVPIAGCSSQQPKDLDLSNVRQVAKLSTLECTYHSVARYGNQANEIPINFINVGYKKYWFEYDANVEVGVDAMQIELVDVPKGDGVVTMTMPEAEVLTQPNIIEVSMTDPITDKGFITEITDEDKKKALEDAQQEIRDKANGDDALKFQARERAKDVVEQYVKNVGNELGYKYTVKFIKPEEKGLVNVGAQDSAEQAENSETAGSEESPDGESSESQQ